MARVERFLVASGLAVAMLVGLAGREARAQSVGIGPRVVMVSGADSPFQDPTDTANTRFTGAFVRLRASKHTGLEVSFDYRTAMNPSATARVRSTPIQGSVLFYPFKTAIAPYLLGGIGWYKQRVEAMSDGKPVLTTDTSKFGYHTGVGGELMLGKHASIFVDYRYTFVNIDGIGGLAGALYSAMSLSTVTGLLSSLTGSGASGSSTASGVSHQGSMWTSGMTFYF